MLEFTDSNTKKKLRNCVSQIPFLPRLYILYSIQQTDIGLSYDPMFSITVPPHRLLNYSKVTIIFKFQPFMFWGATNHWNSSGSIQACAKIFHRLGW